MINNLKEREKMIDKKTLKELYHEAGQKWDKVSAVALNLKMLIDAKCPFCYDTHHEHNHYHDCDLCRIDHDLCDYRTNGDRVLIHEIVFLSHSLHEKINIMNNKLWEKKNNV